MDIILWVVRSKQAGEDVLAASENEDGENSLAVEAEDGVSASEMLLSSSCNSVPLQQQQPPEQHHQPPHQLRYVDNIKMLFLFLLQHLSFLVLVVVVSTRKFLY